MSVITRAIDSALGWKQSADLDDDALELVANAVRTEEPLELVSSRSRTWQRGTDQVVLAEHRVRAVRDGSSFTLRVRSFALPSDSATRDLYVLSPTGHEISIDQLEPVA